MPERNLYALSVEGPAMEPRFREGETIYVDPNERAEHSRFIIVAHDGETPVLRQLVMEGKRKMLKAINPSWPAQIQPMPSDAIICGVVVVKGEVLI